MMRKLGYATTTITEHEAYVASCRDCDWSTEALPEAQAQSLIYDHLNRNFHRVHVVEQRSRTVEVQ